MAESASKELTAAQDIQRMEAQFKAALPAHVSVEKFVRVVMTAVNGNPDLQAADRLSLLEAAMKASQDGLIPDGREAAFVVYNTNVGSKQSPKWIKKVQYLPMVWGIVKKVRNSGELSTISAHVVYEHDEFDYRLGDDESITHKPVIAGDRGAPIAAYAIVKTKDGDIYREVMTREEIEDVKEVSRAKDSGPWAGPFETEMWRKTVIRRLCKRVPMSTDVETVLTRDDDLYDFGKARDVTPQPKTLAAIPHRITEAKRKRLYTLCQQKNVSDEALLEKLKEYGYSSSHEIMDDKYSELMEWADRGGVPEFKMTPDDDDQIPDFEVPKHADDN